MKLALGKLEVRAIEGARMFATRIQRDIEANNREMQRLHEDNQRLIRLADSHTRGVLDAIGEDSGAPIPIEGLQLEKLKDGTGAITFPDPPASVPAPAVEPAPEPMVAELQEAQAGTVAG